MQTRDYVRFADQRERNDELIGVLTAISIVSKRLAGKLAALEHRYSEKSSGNKPAFVPMTGKRNEING
jgi:hypothetical protein